MRRRDFVRAIHRGRALFVGFATSTANGYDRRNERTREGGTDPRLIAIANLDARFAHRTERDSNSPTELARCCHDDGQYGGGARLRVSRNGRQTAARTDVAFRRVSTAKDKRGVSLSEYPSSVDLPDRLSFRRREVAY